MSFSDSNLCSVMKAIANQKFVEGYKYYMQNKKATKNNTHQKIWTKVVQT